MARLIRLLLVDDHPVVLSGLQAALDAQLDLHVVAIASTIADASEALKAEPIDVALVDIRLPDGSGIELLERPQDEEHSPAIILLTTFESPQYVELALRMGASGFLLKTAPIDEIVSAVRLAAAGGLAFTRDQLVVAGRPRWKPLTPRERQVVERVVAGRSNDEIGTDLRLSSKTVEWYLGRLFERFEVASRTELATKAQRDGWVDLPSAADPQR
jgi:two-component system NarL family response regulator